MPRRISFSLTKRQFLDGSKTVTRRLGWRDLRAGDTLLAVEKCMGLKKGEQQKELGEILVMAVRREPLRLITGDDVSHEGFPGRSRPWFVKMFCKEMQCTPQTIVTRIEFKRLP